MPEGIRRVVIAGSVFSFALATGFAMEHGDAVASRLIGAQPEGPIAGLSVRADLPPDPDTPPLPADPATLALRKPAPLPLRQRQATPDLTEALAAQSALSDFGLPCDIAFSAEPGGAGMVHLSLDAPCHAGSVVSIRHAALQFSEVTDVTGALTVDVPALTPDARFVLRFETGATVEARTSVPEASLYERVVLQWQGNPGLELHALEYGASYDDPGHVSRANPRAPARGPNRGTGFLTVLGSAQLSGLRQAEVYSFPTREAVRDGKVALTVEAEITAASCGREVRAELIQPALGGAEQPVTLTLNMPDCSAIGDFLVLNNVVQEMKVATR